MNTRHTKNTNPTLVRLYVVTGKAVGHLTGGEEHMLFRGDIVPADMPAEKVQHLLDVGLIQAHDVPVSN